MTIQQQEQGYRYVASSNALGLCDLTWIVTYQCHLNCQYCYVPTTLARKASDSILSTAQVSDILAQARGLGAQTFSLRGGEPFLRTDLVEILRVADRLDMRSDVVTKVAPSKKLIGRLADLRLLSLGISLDTTDTKVGDCLLSKPGQTLAMMRSLEQLTRFGVVPTVEATVTRVNFDMLDALEAFCSDVGVPVLHLRAAAPHKVRAMDHLLLDAPMTAALMSRAGQRGAVKTVVTPAYLPSPSCGEGLDALTFLPDGKVTKCTASLSRHPKMLYGDLSRQTIEEVLTSQRRMRLLQQVVASAQHLEDDQQPVKGRLPCSQLIDLQIGVPFVNESS